jgi:hypothetical protein
MSEKIVWLIGVLLIAVMAITVIIPTAITSASSAVTSIGSSTETFAGTAATPYSTTYKPIQSVTLFKNGAGTYTANTTVVNVNVTNAVVRVPIDAYASNSGGAWDKVNITFTLTGINATSNVTWVNGTCNGANKTWTSASQSYSDILSSCLTPGSDLVFTFANASGSTTQTANVTMVNVTYIKYSDSTAYTSDLLAGKLTPTASGYYYTAYAFGTTVAGSTSALLFLIPLLIAVVVLMLMIKTSGVI